MTNELRAVGPCLGLDPTRRRACASRGHQERSAHDA